MGGFEDDGVVAGLVGVGKWGWKLNRDSQLSFLLHHGCFSDSPAIPPKGSVAALCFGGMRSKSFI